MNTSIDFSSVDTPCTVIDLGALRRNLQTLSRVRHEAGCRILLALKGFALYPVFPLMREYLDGVCASSPHEARLGREEFQKEVHVFAPAYSIADMQEITKHADDIVFNSIAQRKKFSGAIANAPRHISTGLRINPGYSEVATEIYNPCAPGSRLGIPVEQLKEEDFRGIEGLHFHVMCEQTSDVLERVLAVVEKKCAAFLPDRHWINFGGGHQITRPDYNVEHLIQLIKDFKIRHPHLDVYLEPGEAAALNTGYLVASVLDIVHNTMDIAILDTSVSAHMPDVLEMPYRPQIIDAAMPGEKKHTYRLGGLTCLAGDVIGDYSFDAPLKPGDRLVFTDMAHYTMVKSTTFNGVGLPSIALFSSESGQIEIIRRFGYESFKDRLG